MVRSVSKLVSGVRVPAVPGVPGTRRQQFSASTKRSLVEAAEELFTTQGYAATSLDQVVAGAEVTKGALYHHFSGKQALFEAVFEAVEHDAGRVVATAMASERDPWERAQDGLRAFLDVLEQARYRRIVIQDGPAVLGYERYREREERSTFAQVVAIVDSLLEAGTWAPDEETVQTFARVFFGAVNAAAESVAGAEDREAAARRVETVIGFILAGFRVLAEQGAALPASLDSVRLVTRPGEDTGEDTDAHTGDHTDGRPDDGAPGVSG